jgi:hypothetical protein
MTHGFPITALGNDEKEPDSWYSVLWEMPTNRTGTLYNAVSARPTNWNFNTDGDMEGWQDFNQWNNPQVSNGTLTGTSTGTDPYGSTSSTWIPSSGFETLLISMKVSTGQFGMVFF